MAATFDLDVDQGSTKRFSLTWNTNTGTDDAPVLVPRDLTGCTAKMQVRVAHGKPVLVEISTESVNGNIVLQTGGATGRLDIWLSDENTDLLTVKTTHYDLEVSFPGGDTYRLLQGKITTSLAITQ